MNNPHRFSQLSPNDFDQFDCVKMSKWFYLLLLILLRGYIVWLMSVTNFKDRVGVIEWAYPEPILFYTSLLSGVIGLFVLLIMSLRRPNAANWIKSCWRKIRVLLAFALCFDWLINVGAYYYGIIYQPQIILFHGLLVLLALILLFTNQRIKINIDEFPEKLPE
ncbi:MAG: DUF2919 family protein [Thalassotalea sp.]